MSTLPNIFPAASTGSLGGGETTALEGTSGKTGEPFDHLMARALSPASPEKVNPVAGQNPQVKMIISDPGKRSFPLNKPANPFPSQILNKIIENPDQPETDSGHFPLLPKNSNFSTRTSGKNQPKTTGGHSEVVTNPSAHLEASVAPVNSENVSAPILIAVIATTDQKNGLSAKAADVSVANLKTMVAGKSAEVLTTLPEVKKIPAAGAKVSSPADIEADLTTKSGEERKITAAVEALAVEKTDPADSKAVKPAAKNPQALPLTKDAADGLAAPKLAVEPFVQSPRHEIFPAPDLSTKSAMQKEPEVNGTSVAKQDEPMTKTENTDKTASSAGKILPGASISVARQNNLPVRENSSALGLSRAGQIAANVTANSSPSNGAIDTTPLSADATNLISSAATIDFRSRALERAQDAIVMHATRLSESGNDSLQVVIKPGAGTQLSLELRQRGDGVEATATLQRGDFEHLNQQWPALQQQLEQRGIRLAPLVADGNFANSGENNFQQKQNQSTEPDSSPAFAEVAPAGSFAQIAERVGAHHGWESWA